MGRSPRKASRGNSSRRSSAREFWPVDQMIKREICRSRLPGFRDLVLCPDDVGGGHGNLPRFVEAGAEGRAVVAAELDERDVTVLSIFHPPHRPHVWRCDAVKLGVHEDELGWVAWLCG